ncbi:non-ribosomal peptide synthetase/type I polyketide synthase [Polyangium sp. y55x31]|uniref:non-ribosomal peptide synthetase/type I polyketide synthase n=1 Tax=Polyangium sp. y55x31 TaxID=3042688 RepID=UPI0024829D5F|nr:non-ribosomal peptide synthetase/type I polyketide synthase [Polyangium sp. y55x31]MDI1476289.1 amino acid adenylation domain-containing protein [Polyangium sp. y55x31]
MLVTWNDTTATYPDDRCLHELFEACADKTPGALAVSDEHERLTFQELNHRANGLAQRLVSLGVGPDVPVGVCMQRSVSLAVALLGILKAGGAYMPMDPSYPEERLAFMVADSRAPVIIVHGPYPEIRGQATVLRLDEHETPSDLDAPTTFVRADRTGPEDAAYVIYTSGSTGKPKGVLGSHRAFVNRLSWGWASWPFAPGEVACQKTSIGFVDSIGEILAPLLQGVPSVIVPDASARDPRRLLEVLATEGVTRIVLVPSLLRALLDVEPDLAARLPRLQRWFVSGEALTPDLVARFHERLPGRRLVNLYGSSEAAADSTFFEVPEKHSGPVPIGRPIANTQVYVLDASMQPVAIGMAGELYIGGAGLSRGYLHRPDLTAERFVQNPFGPPGSLLYRTSDRARWRHDGNLEYLGRLAHQVKIRGARVDLGEIEGVLREHPAVREAAVVLRELHGEEGLIAYVAAGAEHPPQSELAEWLRQKLPAYMLPSVFVVLDALPLTPSGKIDRQALPAPAFSDAPRMLPRTPTEAVIAELWGNVFGLDSVGIHDDFFALGGHSLLAARLLSLVYARLGVDLPLSAVFEAPTIARLADRIDASIHTAAVPPAPPLVRAPRLPAVPMSFAQQRLWFIAQVDPASAIYNEIAAFDLRGRLDVVALDQSLRAFAARHEALRTTFGTRDGQPVQIVHSTGSIPLFTVDLTMRAAEERDAAAHMLGQEHAREPFDLARGPVARALLVKLGPTEHRLFFVVHHIVYDRTSLVTALVPDLLRHYEAFSTGKAPRLPDLPVQYADFAIWQRGWLSENVLRPSITYWKGKLAGLPVLDLPTDRPGPAKTRRGARHTVELPVELVHGLRALARGERVTLFTTLLSTFLTLLHRYTGQQDVPVGIVTAGRSRAETNGVFGCFINPLVVRGDLSGDPTFRTLLERVREVTSEAYRHQDVPFERLVQELRPARAQHQTPLFQVVFSYNDAPVAPHAPLDLPELSVRVSEIGTGTAKFDLTFDLEERGEEIAGFIEYAADLFDAATIARMAEHFRSLLEAVVRDLELPLSALPLLTPAEADEILHLAGSDAPYPEDACLHELIELQVRTRPEAPAAIFEGETLSYLELDSRANQLAHYLRSLGVGPEVRVGICLERSFEALISLLGVLKAGGAFVPLDPAYPRARLSFILEDAGAAVLLTDRRSLGTLPDPRMRVVLLDEEIAAIEAEPKDRPVTDVGPDNLAYIIYTSGSTGRPKGVLVPHRGLCSLAPALITSFEIGPTSRVLQFASPSFDASVMEIIMALPAGAALVLAPPSALLPGPSLRKLLRDRRVTVALLCPSAIAALDAGGDGAEASLPLQTLIAGGEPCTAQLVARWAPGRRFFNAYGPTEATICATLARCTPDGERPPIGRPVPNARCYVLDAQMRLLPRGVPGELFIGGVGVTRGYLDRPEISAERFVPNPFGSGRLYRTGDRVRFRNDGNLEFLGRMDEQLKLRGFRIEPGEIEAELDRHPAVQVSAAKLVEMIGGEKRLVAYVVPRSDAPGDLPHVLKRLLRECLPEHMVPSAILRIDRMPVGPNGKIDRSALPAPPSPERVSASASTSLERTVAAIWREVLGLEGDVGVDEPFFEVGGHSLALSRVQAKLSAQLGTDVDVVTLLKLPTIRQLAAHLAKMSSSDGALALVQRSPEKARDHLAVRPDALAIVGIAIRAPDIRNANELWEVVRAGRVTIRALDRDALVLEGADPQRVHRPEFVAAEGVLDDSARFDAGFFGYSDADAALMDPQQRVFLECAYEALENAGYDPARFPGKIGVFGGTGVPRHWLGPVMDKLRAGGSDLEGYRALTLNAQDFLATRVAFKLGLRGPAVTVQTACSTSLSAVHMARQSLIAGECDMAIAGGVSLASLGAAERGYLHAEGGIYAPDGVCRPFDADASGTVKSSGAALVVLKRLSDALSDGDTIHAVLLGSAMNNDGAGKVGFTAPSEDGLAAAIGEAYERAGVDPGSIRFVEAHGTGTRLGDPTEVRALSRAFRRWTEQRGFCALGSLKANLGHLDAAAGAAGLVKAALALRHGVIPPNPSFRTPNALLELPTTPFFVNDAPLPWPRETAPRRAGVSAMGIGGTNVHVVLEEAPQAATSPSQRPFQLLCLAARTPSALAESVRRLRAHLASDPSVDVADAAYTLALGRAQGRHRMAIVGRNAGDLPWALDASEVPSAVASTARPVVFLFPGHGVQYLKMGAEVYDAEPVYREEVDRCVALLREVSGLDLAPLLFGLLPDGERKLDEMQWAQPLLFVVEYALARQYLAWGVKPAAMLGHSLGEYVAACIAGVLSLRDALVLVALRGRLMDATPPGGMLSVFADERTALPFLHGDVVIATHAPGCVVLSGPVDEIEVVRARLTGAAIETSTVRVSRASHSPLMFAIREEFRQRVAQIELHPPTLPIVSNVTGAYLTPEQATDPEYWADHLCSAVRLGDGLGTLLELGAPVCLELGPGNTLGSFLKAQSLHATASCDVVGNMPGYRKRDDSSHAALLAGVGKAWALGVEIDWRAFFAHERRRRIPLPTYPFEGRVYSLSPKPKPEPKPEPVRTRASLDDRADALAQEFGVRGIDGQPGLRARLEAFCASLVLDFFGRRLGAELGRGRSLSVLQKDAGILPKFAPMLARLTQILIRAGLARRTPEGDLVLSAAQAGRAAERSAEMRRDFPGFAGLFRFIEHCVNHYDDALTGAVEPVGILYPDGTDAFHRACMQDTQRYLYEDVYLSLAREAVVDIVARRRGRKTRMLEVGAGHGSLSWPLMELLRGADVEYHFSDVGRSFLQRAEAEAARRGIDWMKAIRFDLNRSPEEQGIHERYDVILGFNSVHVALDLPAALGRLRDRLNPGGSLVLVEATRTETWDFLTWGLAPGFWEIDKARGHGLSMDLDHWLNMLRQAGFAQMTAVPTIAERRNMQDHGLLIAEREQGVERPAHETTRRAATSNVVQGGAVAAFAPGEMMFESSNALASDATEQIVRDMWKRMLGVENPRPGESFFDLGGDSLLAVQLLAELHMKTGQRIKNAAFATNPTLGGLVALVRAAGRTAPAQDGRGTTVTNAPAAARTPAVAAAPSPVVAAAPSPAPAASSARAGVAAAVESKREGDCLVPLRSTGAKRPIFFVHPIGGGALCYAPLAAAMASDRPFYGLQSPMLEDQGARAGSVEDMAVTYVDAIQRVQPRGPYLLGGWSFGGLVAAEMARVLRSRGETVAQLVLIDVYASVSDGVGLLRRLDPRLPALSMLPAIFAEAEGAGGKARAQRDGVERLSAALGIASRHLGVYDHHLALWSRHRPSEQDVPATHFRASEKSRLLSVLRPSSGKDLPIRGMDVVQVPGDHFSMLAGENVKNLAGRIEALLEATESRKKTGGGAEDVSSPVDAISLKEAEDSVRAYMRRFVSLTYVGGQIVVDEMLTQSDTTVVFDVSNPAYVGAKVYGEHLERQFHVLQDLRKRMYDDRVVVFAGGRAACAMATFDSEFTHAKTGRRIFLRQVRMSWFLERSGDSWRAVHVHCSLPVGEPLYEME